MDNPTDEELEESEAMYEIQGDFIAPKHHVSIYHSGSTITVAEEKSERVNHKGGEELWKAKTIH